MAQVHYVIMGDYDEEVVYAYLSANKGKINKLARDFEQTEDEDGGTRNYIWEQGSAKYKDSFMFVMNNGEMYCEAVTEEEFRNKAESMEYAAFFTGLKDLEINIPIENAGFDEDLEFSEADYYGDEPKLVWAYYEYVVGESKQTKAMKYIPTFESFIGSQKVNERYATFADVFDEYGTSMIAVSIRPDGMVNEGVSRYNHDVKYKKKARLSSTDHSFNEEEISNLLGAPIFELLPSSNPVKSRSEDNSQEVIKKGTKVLTSGDASRQMYLHQGNYYLIIEGSVFKDRRTNKLFEFSSVKKIKRKSDGSVAGYLFYYTIKDRNKANSFVMGFDKNLKMIIPAKEIDREESNPKTLARAVLASTALEEE